MKLLLISISLVMLAACGQQAVYDMMHEKNRQECLKDGHSDCPRAESYDEYKKQRDEVIQYKDINE